MMKLKKVLQIHSGMPAVTRGKRGASEQILFEPHQQTDWGAAKKGLLEPSVKGGARQEGLAAGHAQVCKGTNERERVSTMENSTTRAPCTRLARGQEQSVFQEIYT